MEMHPQDADCLLIRRFSLTMVSVVHIYLGALQMGNVAFFVVLYCA